MEAYLNRSVMIIIPQKPFYDWINYIEPTHPISDDGDYNAFLLPDGFRKKDADLFVQDNYQAFFEDYLNSMWTDESDWPQKRSFAVFKEWFTWKFASSVEDLRDDTPLIAG